MSKSPHQENTFPTFELWLEFEHWEWQEGDDLENDFFNMVIHLADGKSYALNVRTYKFFDRARQEAQITGSNLAGKFLLPPDLLVEQLDRKLMEDIVTDLIATAALKTEWLVQRKE